MKKSLLCLSLTTLLLLVLTSQWSSAQSYYNLGSGSFSQNWSNTGLITVNDDWTGVSSIIGYRGDNGTPGTGTDPQTIVMDLITGGVVNVLANQTTPNTISSGGIAEFEITDPVVAFQGSGTADAPNLVIFLDATARASIRVQYDLRDVDGSTDNSVQAVALQYRIGTTGDFVNVPAGFIADASTGPDLATQVTHVDVTLPNACNGRSSLQVRIITSNAVGSDEWIGIDNIEISSISDVVPPTATFIPANGASDVAKTVNPTITFDEPVRKTGGNSLENSDLSAILTFRKTDASGPDVPFSANIDASKEVITITPISELDNSQSYYIAIGPVEDASGNVSTGSNVTFTTISAATPSISLIYPAGGEVMYAGQAVTITWTSENVTNVLIEVFGPDNDVTRVFGWMSFVPTTSAAAGMVDTIVPPDAPYGTVYRIRISDIDNPSVVSTGGDFTIISVATSLSELRTGFTEGYIKLNDIVKLSSEAIITFKAPYSNIYVQDAGAGILVYDSGSKMTGYNEMDGVTGLTGTIATYSNILEIIPNASPGAATSTNNTITPVILTASSLNTDYDTYESMIIKINDVTFANAGGTFASSASYNITDVSGTTVFYTKFSSADYIGTTIPAGARNVTGICLQYNTTGEIASRNLLDFEAATGIESTSDQQAEIYPIPATSELKVRNIMNVKTINILDMTGKIIRTTNAGTENEITIPVNDLKSGIYFIRLSTKNGSVIRRFVK